MLASNKTYTDNLSPYACSPVLFTIQEYIILDYTFILWSKTVRARLVTQNQIFRISELIDL